MVCSGVTYPIARSSLHEAAHLAVPPLDLRFAPAPGFALSAAECHGHRDSAGRPFHRYTSRRNATFPETAGHLRESIRGHCEFRL